MNHLVRSSLIGSSLVCAAWLAWQHHHHGQRPCVNQPTDAQPRAACSTDAVACASGTACVAAATDRPNALPDLAPLATRSCKPEAPIELELGAPRSVGADRIEVGYTLVAGVDCALLEPLVDVRSGAALVAHTPAAAGDVTRGATRVGSITLQRNAGSDAAVGFEIVARFALPEPEAVGGSVVMQRSFAFGARAPAVVAGVRRVHSGDQVSNDVPVVGR